MKKWTYMKAIESCFGQENMKQYMVNMKKAVAKCTQQDAPELNLPPFRNTYRFINTMLTNADQMEDNKMMQLFHVMNKMEKMREYSHHSVGPWASEYDQSSWMEQMMENMMMHKMKNDDSSSYRQRMAALLSRNKRQANKGQGRKDSATTLPATLDIGDKLVEK